jgi:hypothetical protein
VEKPTVTVQLNENDYVEGALFASRWTRNRLLFVWGMIAIYLGGGIFSVFFAPHDLFALGCALICGTWINRYVVLPKKLKSLFAERKASQRRSTLSWDEQSLTVEGENSRALIPWADFFKFRENGEFVLLYTSRILFIIVPKRFLEESGQLNGFMALVRSTISAQ